MARPRIWGNEKLSEPIFIRLPKAAADKLEDLAYDSERSVAAVARSILCEKLEIKRPPRKKRATR